MKRSLSRIVTILTLSLTLLLAGCTSAPTVKKVSQKDLHSDPPNGVYYELFVRAFYDSNGDGIGDLKGATEKLDYLKSLGIEGIWLMPINPSPSYHGYDITDYKGINPDYGTMADFQNFIKEAHKRGIKVLMDLVVNHTSINHPWFKAASADVNSPYRNYYVWADENTNTNRPGEWGQNVWHSFGSSKYEGIFWEGMPDLNYDNPKVRSEIIDVGKYWLNKGVDGYRLDAAMHIYSYTEDKDHEWWKQFHAAMKTVNPNVFLVGEVWAAPSVIGPYLDKGLTSGFNFDLSSRIIDSVRNETDTGVPFFLTRVREYYKKISHNTYVDSIFLTNHDMDRVMSDLNGNIDHAKMAASILLTLPGNPFIYYGEEVGMEGRKPDEHIREPMVWTVDQNTPGETNWVNSVYNQDRGKKAVEVQLKDKNSLLNYYKKLIYARRSDDVLIKGEIAESPINEKGILSFKRVLGKKEKLVIHNLTSTKKEIHLEKTNFNHIYFTTKESAVLTNNILKVPAYSTIILDKK